MRSRFDEQLQKLNDALIDMGMSVEEAIANASKAFNEQDIQLAKQVIAADDEIDQQEREIERLCLRIILQQQPVASDLRDVSSALKIITDLERIGDHASDISDLAIQLAKEQYRKKPEYVPQMAEITMKMVANSIDAFVRQDLELAEAVLDSDDIVDNLFEAVKRDLVEQIKDNTLNSDHAIDLVMVAKYLERIGDHATNIAEWVIFSLTGIHKNRRIL